jgi:uncharacterized protein YecE (DUF72 family)
VTVRVGTSGWQYKDWRGPLYPPRVPRRLWLETYAGRFSTVELNNAFYRLPEVSAFESWRERTPDGFVMAVKASRFLTHVKRLREPEEPVERLLSRARGLGDRLGPVLLQLPPDLRAEPGRLDACLASFPADIRVAVEPRHPSWWSDETEAVLRGRGAALCWADRESHPVTPLWRTADWGYLRLHAGRARPWPSYGRQALVTWADRIAGTFGSAGTGGCARQAADAYVYFNNDLGGAAVRDATVMESLVTRREPNPRPSGEAPQSSEKPLESR